MQNPQSPCARHWTYVVEANPYLEAFNSLYRHTVNNKVGGEGERLNASFKMTEPARNKTIM